MAARVICMRRLAVAAALLVGVPAVVISTGGCAGYRFGNNTLYASNVRTVYVPMIQSESFRTTPGIDLGERLTEAVCKEIEKRTPFKVVGDPNADSVLTARIVADTKRVGRGADAGGERRRGAGRDACAGIRPLGGEHAAGGHREDGPADRGPDGRTVVAGFGLPVPRRRTFAAPILGFAHSMLTALRHPACAGQQRRLSGHGQPLTVSARRVA